MTLDELRAAVAELEGRYPGHTKVKFVTRKGHLFPVATLKWSTVFDSFRGNVILFERDDSK